MVTKKELEDTLAEQTTSFKEIIADSISSIRGEIIKTLTEENLKLSNKISSLETRIVTLERSMQNNLQYMLSYLGSPLSLNTRNSKNW